MTTSQTMINMPQLRVKRGSVIKRQKSQTASDYEWLRVTTSDYKWLRAGVRVTTSHYNWLRETTSQASSDCKWPRMTASDYQPSYEWLQLGLAITLGIKAFIISYYCTTISKVNTLKSVLKIVVLRFWWKSLKNARDAEAVICRCFSK